MTRMNVQLLDDCMIIDSRENAKKMFFALLMCSPICLIDWILVWTGLAEPDEPKIASGFLIAFFVFAFFCAAIEARITIRFDKDGATRTIFGIYTVFIPWDEMKYIGAGFAPRDYYSSIIYPNQYEMLFSKIPYMEYKRFHTLLHRLLDTRYIIRLGYIDDETYEKILEFSGGERNIP